MHRRRDFILSAASLAAAGAVLASCTTTAKTPASPPEAPPTGEPLRREIEAGVDATLPRLYQAAPGSQELVAKASGVLVFPRVIAAGLVAGGQYGEGALRIKGRTEGYYSQASVSPGLRAGAQSKSIIFLFMTPDALDKFRIKETWTVGADASVGLLKVGAGGVVQAVPVSPPVAAFVLTSAGLVENLSLEGTKVSRLKI